MADTENNLKRQMAGRLHEAVRQGNLELVTQYLDEKIDPNEICDGDAALHATAYLLDNPFVTVTPETRLKIVELLLKSGANINQQDSCGRTILWHAAYLHDSDFVRFLLENNAKLEIADTLGDTPLNAASPPKAEIGFDIDRSIMVEILLKAGANIDARNECGFTPRNHLLMSGKEQLINLVEKYGSASAPAPSKNAQGLADLLSQFSSLFVSGDLTSSTYTSFLNRGQEENEVQRIAEEGPFLVNIETSEVLPRLKK